MAWRSVDAILTYRTLILNAVEHSLSSARSEATKPLDCDRVHPKMSFGSLTGTPGSEYTSISIITEV